MGITRGAVLSGALAALTLSPVALAQAQDREPPPQREEACDRSRAPEGQPPFCEEYPPPERDVACDRSKAPPGRPPFCEARNFTAASQATVLLYGPQSGDEPAAAGAQVREYTVEVDQAGVARFAAPQGLAPGRYRVVFAPVGAEVAPHMPGQSFQVVPAAADVPPAVLASGPVVTNGMLAGAGVLVAAAGATAAGTVVAVRRRRDRGSADGG